MGKFSVEINKTKQAVGLLPFSDYLQYFMCETAFPKQACNFVFEEEITKDKTLVPGGFESLFEDGAPLIHLSQE